MKVYLFIILTLSVIIFLAPTCKEKGSSTEEQWESIFNGKDLDGWQIKIAGEPLDQNYKNTFRVEDSMLRVVYDDYENFDNKFGHIYTKTPYSYYKLRFQYRFTGKRVHDAPVWADMNSGIMLHSQSGKSMEIDQAFPVSLEMQLLADTGSKQKTTGNICTPGTLIHISDTLRKEHCINSASKHYPVGQWVNATIEVYGDSLVRHIIETDTVMTYTKVQIGGGFINETSSWLSSNIRDSMLWISKANSPLTEGYLALQAESQPIDFRKLEILNLLGCMDRKSKNYKKQYIKPDDARCKD